MSDTPTKDKAERLIALLGLLFLVAAFGLNLLPDEVITDKAVVPWIIVIAGGLLITWVLLLVANVYRFFSEEGYSIWKLLAALFIPFVGVIVASLYSTKRKVEVGIGHD